MLPLIFHSFKLACAHILYFKIVFISHRQVKINHKNCVWDSKYCDIKECSLFCLWISAVLFVCLGYLCPSLLVQSVRICLCKYESRFEAYITVNLWNMDGKESVIPSTWQ